MKKGVDMRDPSNKFRVWDREEHCYQESDADYCRINYNGELECMFTYDNGIGCGYEYIQDHCIIERCTGKADKNGNPMYAGDLVRCANGTVAPIVWDQDRCTFLIDTKPYRTEISGFEEIVGNIHEEVKDD